MKKSEFYTLHGYRSKNKATLTESMEDYLEMIYRISQKENVVMVKNLAYALNVKSSSASKMCKKLKLEGFILFERYGKITLTAEGKKMGTYLLWRHQLLETLLKLINQDSFHLEQVEKVEHFVDFDTLYHIEKFLKERMES